jgi:hypothetical protein
MLIARLILALNSLGFTAYGLLFLLWPEGMATYVGLLARTPTAITDVRTTHGGLALSIATLLGFCAISIGGTAFGLLAATCICAGLAGGRLLAMLLAGGGDAVTWLLFSLPLCGLLLDTHALRRLKRDPRG